MAQAIQMDEYGPPEVLHLAEVSLPPLGPTEIRFRVLAAALNHSDIEIRSGNWPIMAPTPFPYTPGLAAAVHRAMESGRLTGRALLLPE